MPGRAAGARWSGRRGGGTSARTSALGPEELLLLCSPASPRAPCRERRAYAAAIVIGGEGGIRTPGTGFNPVQQISNLSCSATPAPLRTRVGPTTVPVGLTVS